MHKECEQYCSQWKLILDIFFLGLTVESLSETVQNEAGYHAVVHFKPLLADPNKKKKLSEI